MTLQELERLVFRLKRNLTVAKRNYLGVLTSQDDMQRVIEMLEMMSEQKREELKRSIIHGP